MRVRQQVVVTDHGRLDELSQTGRSVATLHLERYAFSRAEGDIADRIHPAEVPHAHLVNSRPKCPDCERQTDAAIRVGRAGNERVPARGAGRTDDRDSRLPARNSAAGAERLRRRRYQTERGEGGSRIGRRRRGRVVGLYPYLRSAFGKAGLATRGSARAECRGSEHHNHSRPGVHIARTTRLPRLHTSKGRRPF